MIISSLFLVHLSMYCANVLVEFISGLGNLFEQFGRENRALIIRVMVGECCSSLEGVTNLSAIPQPNLGVFVFFVMFFGVIENFPIDDPQARLLCNLSTCIFDSSETMEILLPDFERLLFRQWWVAKTDVDARFESVIKHTNPVGSEEEYSLVILKDAQEDFDMLVVGVR
jgi:hypothetical protein